MTQAQWLPSLALVCAGCKTNPPGGLEAGFMDAAEHHIFVRGKAQRNPLPDIGHGIRLSGMPGSKDLLSDDEIWSIVVCLRHLPPTGSCGEPEMYSY